MITPNEVKRKSIQNSDPENYSHTLEVRIDDAPMQESCAL